MASEDLRVLGSQVDTLLKLFKVFITQVEVRNELPTHLEEGRLAHDRYRESLVLGFELDHLILGLR